VLDLKGLSLRAAPPPEPVAPKPKPSRYYLAGTVVRPALRSRNGVQYLVCRSWSVATKKADLEAFKQFKLELPEAGISDIVNEMRDLLSLMVGDPALLFRSVVPIACGHSRRPDCLSFRIASALAEMTGIALVGAFAPRYLTGGSHPKEFRDIPPLDMVRRPDGPVLVVDDISTSGFHMEEALGRLRAEGLAAMGIVMVAGAVQPKAA